MAIRALLDLRRIQRHRTFWAFILTAWQGARRCGDLIAPKKVQGRPWDPRLCLHRSRLRVTGLQRLRCPGRQEPRHRQHPQQCEPPGRAEGRVLLPRWPHPWRPVRSRAIWDVLRHDPHPGLADQTPVFVDPRTGLEITHAAVSAFLDYWLTRAGFPALATGTHALRMVGATSVASLCTDGHLLSGLMGSWSSSAQHQYVWAMRHRLEGASREIGRAGPASGALAARPGPLGRLGAGRAPFRGGLARGRG